jgi:hypothetical protein
MPAAGCIADGVRSGCSCCVLPLLQRMSFTGAAVFLLLGQVRLQYPGQGCEPVAFTAFPAGCVILAQLRDSCILPSPWLQTCTAPTANVASLMYSLQCVWHYLKYNSYACWFVSMQHQLLLSLNVAVKVCTDL